MIETTITTNRGRPYGEPDGPTECARCGRSLLDRSDDRTDTASGPLNEELILHIWEHDVDDAGRAICGACVELDDQTEAWRQIVAWRSRSEARSFLVSNRGVELFDSGTPACMFVAARGLLTVGAVLAFVGRDPLRPGASSRPPAPEPPRFELLAGDMHEATMEMGANLRAWSDADELQPARDFAWADECPETERNTEHE